jgi:hypothetical protein
LFAFASSKQALQIQLLAIEKSSGLRKNDPYRTIYWCLKYYGYYTMIKEPDKLVAARTVLREPLREKRKWSLEIK